MKIFKLDIVTCCTKSACPIIKGIDRLTAQILICADWVVLQRKPFAFELFFGLANAGFFPFNSKTCSIVLTSNLSTKYINLHKKTVLTYFKTSLAAF